MAVEHARGRQSRSSAGPMMRAYGAILLGSIAAAGSASTQGAGPSRVEIDFSNFHYTPSQIRLHYGQSYVFHFVNQSSGGHDFSAKEFFAAASVDPADRARISNGEVELRGGESADVHLVAPAPGRYKAHCTHFMHSAFGMKTSIIVD